MLKDHFNPANELLYGEVKEPNSSKFLSKPPPLCHNVSVDSQAGEHFELQAVEDILNFLAAVSKGRDAIAYCWS
jgi:hypothetical protein